MFRGDKESRQRDGKDDSLEAGMFAESIRNSSLLCPGGKGQSTDIRAFL